MYTCAKPLVPALSRMRAHYAHLRQQGFRPPVAHASNWAPPTCTLRLGRTTLPPSMSCGTTRLTVSAAAVCRGSGAHQAGGGGGRSGGRGCARDQPGQLPTSSQAICCMRLIPSSSHHHGHCVALGRRPPACHMLPPMGIAKPTPALTPAGRGQRTGTRGSGSMLKPSEPAGPMGVPPPASGNASLAPGMSAGTGCN